MDKLSKVLGVIGMLMAIAAAALSFMLMQARNDFVLRAEKLSQTVRDMVTVLDKESNTNVAAKVTFRAGDPISGTRESGTLSRTDFKNAKTPDGGVAAYQKNLDEAKKLATSIIEQRNLLATKLAEIGSGFLLPDMNPDDLKNAESVEKYTAAVERIADHCRAIKVRDEAMIKTVVSASTTIKHPVEEKVFVERATAVNENGATVLKDFNHSQSLADFATHVANLYTRAGDYAKTLSESMDHVDKFTWQTDKAQLASETEYAGALTAIGSDFDGINTELKKFEICRSDLESTRKKLENKIIDLEKNQKLLAQSEQERERQENEIKRLKKILGDSNQPAGTQERIAFDANLEGRVLQVNKDWNFVIINLGINNIREKMNLIVAREDRYIARLEVSKVFKNVCVAEILPEVQTGVILPADKVIFPKEIPPIEPVKEQK